MASSSSSRGEGVLPIVPPSSLSERAPVVSERAPSSASATAAISTTLKPPPPLLRQASSIARQSSIFSLTLDEFQNALGEPGKHFGSMNMDEFLKNIWTAEESQAMAVAIGAGNDEPSHAWHAGVQRQGSISLPRTLSRKTVEDVWKDIAGASIDMGLGLDPTSGSAGQERQATFAEMTLEDFLVKAGVVVKETGPAGQPLTPFGMNFDKTSLDNAFNSIPGDDGHGSAFFGYKGVEDVKPNVKALPTLSLSTGNLKSNQAGQMEALKHISPQPRALDWLTNNPFRSGTAHMHTHQAYSNLPQHVVDANANQGSIGNGALMGPATAGVGILAENNLVDFGVGAGGLAPCPLGMKIGSPSSPLSDDVGPSHGSMSSLSPLSYGHDGAIGGRKRCFEGGLEKVVERRQRRMIKNRESAARSRARKQAYTVELEAEVMQLKEENLRLRLLQEERADMRRKQFMDVLKSLGPHEAPKARTLRRTQTGPW